MPATAIVVVLHGKELGSAGSPAPLDGAPAALGFVQCPVILTCEAVHGHPVIVGGLAMVALSRPFAPIALPLALSQPIFAKRLTALGAVARLRLTRFRHGDGPVWDSAP